MMSNLQIGVEPQNEEDEGNFYRYISRVVLL